MKALFYIHIHPCLQFFTYITLLTNAGFRKIYKPSMSVTHGGLFFCIKKNSIDFVLYLTWYILGGTELRTPFGHDHNLC